MRNRFANDEWWVASMSMLLFSNAILAYWVVCETFGWQNGYLLGDTLHYITFFPGMFLAPIASLLGFRTAMHFAQKGNLKRSAILAFLTGGAMICAFVSWNAHLGGGR